MAEKSTLPEPTTSKAQMGPIIAIGGLLILTVLILTGVQAQQLPNLPNIFSLNFGQKPPVAQHRLIEANLADAAPRLSTDPVQLPEQPFQGEFDGFSTEGPKRNEYTLQLSRDDKRVTGDLITRYGERGHVEGHVNGQTFFYHWQVGNRSGRGIYIQADGTLRGTWGYDNSAQNGGRSLLHFKKPLNP